MFSKWWGILWWVEKKTPLKRSSMAKCCLFRKRVMFFFSPGQTLPEDMMYSCICATPFQQLDVVSNAFSQIFSRSLSISPPPINTHFNLIMIDCNVIQEVVSNIFLFLSPEFWGRCEPQFDLHIFFQLGLEKVLGCWGTKRWDGKPKKTFPQIFVHSTFWCFNFPRQNGFLLMPTTPSKLNSSPLKKWPSQMERGFFQPSFFRGELLIFRGLAKSLGQKGEASLGSPLWCEIAS